MKEELINPSTPGPVVNRGQLVSCKLSIRCRFIPAHTAIALSLIAVLAGLVPARRALSIDTAIALRHD